jgi:hypothetical protein
MLAAWVAHPLQMARLVSCAPGTQRSRLGRCATPPTPHPPAAPCPHWRHWRPGPPAGPPAIAESSWRLKRESDLGRLLPTRASASASSTGDLAEGPGAGGPLAGRGQRAGEAGGSGAGGCRPSGPWASSGGTPAGHSWVKVRGASGPSATDVSWLSSEEGGSSRYASASGKSSARGLGRRARAAAAGAGALDLVGVVTAQPRGADGALVSAFGRREEVTGPDEAPGGETGRHYRRIGRWSGAQSGGASRALTVQARCPGVVAVDGGECQTVAGGSDRRGDAGGCGGRVRLPLGPDAASTAALVVPACGCSIGGGGGSQLLRK